MATTVPGPVESHDNDWTSAETAAGRNVGLSLWRGVRGKWPRCRHGRLFCAIAKLLRKRRHHVSSRSGPVLIDGT